jgi:hypothetical protein
MDTLMKQAICEQSSRRQHVWYNLAFQGLKGFKNRHPFVFAIFSPPSELKRGLAHVGCDKSKEEERLYRGYFLGRFT